MGLEYSASGWKRKRARDHARRFGPERHAAKLAGKVRVTRSDDPEAEVRRRLYGEPEGREVPP